MIRSASEPGRRVALYIDSLKAGGAERITLTMARWLLEAGWQPVLLTRQPSSHDFYPVPESLSREVEASDPRWLRALGWFGFPWRVLRLRHWLRQRRIDLAIGMTTLPAVKLLLACGRSGTPCVVSERNYPPAKPPAMAWRLLRRLTYPWARLHLVQTRFTGAWMARHLHAEAQLLLPNPVPWPLPRFEPSPDPRAWLAERGVSSEAAILLAVGTKIRQKGFDRLVRIFQRLAPDHPHLHLLIVGVSDSPQAGAIQSQPLRLMLEGSPQLQQRLHLPGRVGNIADWYAVADLFVLPSRFEGFPNVLLEAMAAGCTCVANDCLTGPAEIIRAEVDGVLMAADASEAQWADCLDQLLRDPQRRAQLASQAVGVRERYGEAALKQQFLDALTALPARLPSSR